MAVYLSPGVYPREVDYSAYTAGLSTTIVGLVGGATRGPLTPTVVTNSKQLHEIFGPNVESDFGVISAERALAECGIIYFTRVVGSGAKYAYAGNRNGNNRVPPVAATGTLKFVSSISSICFSRNLIVFSKTFLHLESMNGRTLSEPSRFLLAVSCFFS